MTSHARCPSPRAHRTHRVGLILSLLGALSASPWAMAQDAQVEARRHVVPPTATTAAPISPAPEGPISTNARFWLDTQASGTLASPHKQTLNGPAMSRVYQRLLRQLSGKSQGAGDSTESASDADADSKSNPAGDLLKGLSALKP